MLPHEIANVLAWLVFDGDLELDDIADIWSDLSALGGPFHPFGPILDGPQVAVIATRLRRRHATDAAYIYLAQHLGTAAWTLDGALARNAAEVDLPVNLVA